MTLTPLLVACVPLLACGSSSKRSFSGESGSVGVSGSAGAGTGGVAPAGSGGSGETAGAGGGQHLAQGDGGADGGGAGEMGPAGGVGGTSGQGGAVGPAGEAGERFGFGGQAGADLTAGAGAGGAFGGAPASAGAAGIGFGAGAGGAETGGSGGAETGGTGGAETGGTGGAETGGTGGTETGGTGGSATATCASGERCPAATPYCLDGICVECEPGVQRCASATSLERCSAPGAWEVATINFNFDPDHCGVCGHSCLGGECSAGQCVAASIAVEESMPHGVTTFGDHVYYVCSRSGLIRRVSKVPGSLPETIADRGSGWPLDIVHGNGNLYFTEADVVFRLVPDGSAAPTAFYNSVWTDPGDHNIVDIASDEGDPDISDLENQLLWVHEGSWLLSGRISATTVQGNRIFATGGPGPAGGVEIDKDWYFHSRVGTGHDDGYVRARVRSDPLTSITVTTTGHPVALAFDGMHLYWAKAKADDMSTEEGDDYLPNSGAIQRSELDPVSRTFGTPETLVDGVPEPVDLIVDDQWVYWISSFASDGGANMHRLSRMPKNGGAEAILNEGNYGPAHITQDGTSVYWTVMGHPSGSVKRWAK